MAYGLLTVGYEMQGRLCWRLTPTQPATQLQQAQQLSSCVLQLDEPHFIITTDALHTNKCSSLAHVGVAVLTVCVAAS
jgi:hypothetical protein